MHARNLFLVHDLRYETCYLGKIGTRDVDKIILQGNPYVVKF